MSRTELLKHVCKILIAVLCIACAFTCGTPGKAGGKSFYVQSPGNGSKKTAVIAVLDRIDIYDLTGNCPNIQNLMKNGAIALMNTKTAGRHEHKSAYLTIGAGTRAYAAGYGGLAFGAEEEYQGQKCGTIFENYTGTRASVSNIVVLDFPRILGESKKQDHEIVPGLLGGLLKNRDVPVAVLGNADTAKDKSRPAAMIAMDTAGIVETGDVSAEILKEDAGSPFFIKTDYESLYRKFLGFKERGGLIILHLGDTVRADDYVSCTTAERYNYFRRKAINEADEFIGRVLSSLDLSRDLFMVVTPFPSQSGYSNRNLLTPFIMAGAGIDPGFAVSATTRRPGIITNLDIAPTVLSFFNIPAPVVMLGHPVRGQRATAAFASLLEENRKIVATYIQRAYVIKPYVVMQIVVSLGFLALILLEKNWLPYIRPFILANMSLPFGLLILPKLASYTLWSKYVWLSGLTAGTVLAAMSLRRTSKSIIFICLVTACTILFDLSSGSPLMKSSILGYDPIGGARYYGLGNEYMGVLIGSLVIGMTALFDEFKFGSRISGWGCTLISPAVFAAAFYMIFSPRYGSNAGGGISALGAFLTTLLMIWGTKMKTRRAAVLTAVTAIALLMFFIMPGRSTPPSHISQTIAIVKEQGPAPLLLIASRKLAMNLKLFRYTPWTRALLASIAVIVALFYRPPHTLKKIFYRNHNLYSGFVGTCAGCVLALVFNDSGIVAAATMMIFIALPVALLVIDELNTNIT